MSVYALNADDKLAVEKLNVGLEENGSAVLFEMSSPWSGTLFHRQTSASELRKIVIFLGNAISILDQREQEALKALRLNEQDTGIIETTLRDASARKPAKNRKLPVNGALIPTKKLKANPRTPAVKKSKKR